MIDRWTRRAHNASVGAGDKKRKWSFLGRTGLPLTLLLICAGWAVLSQLPVVRGLHGPILLGPDGFLSFLENPTIDARFSYRGEIPSPLKVIYVDVDSESLGQYGNVPWNRKIFARVTDALFRHGKIRGLGFDFVFSDAGLPNLGRAEAEEGSVALGRSIHEHQAVVVAASYSDLGTARSKSKAVRGSKNSLRADENGNENKSFPFLYDRRTSSIDAALPEVPGYPVVGPTWGRIGLINVANDDVRIVPMFARTEQLTYLTMALQLALLHYGLPPSAVEIGEDCIVLRGDESEVSRIPLWQRQLVEVNWFSSWAQNPGTSVLKLLAYVRDLEEGSPEDKARAEKFFAEFNDGIVLVGPTDPLLKDVSPAPLSEGDVPRVSVHGNMLKTILGGRYILRPPVWLNVALIYGLGIGVAALAMAGDTGRFRLGRWLSLLLAAAYVGAAFVVFARFDLLIPLVAPVGAAASCALVGVMARLAAEEERRLRIKGLFGSYVSAAVVDEIVDKDIVPQTGGAEVEVTAFFSDVVSFTSLSQKLSPTELVALMSEYFAEGTAAITAAGGTLDKYVGDAIIAMFGAPVQRKDHAAAACRAALALIEGQSALRRRWAAAGRPFPVEALDMRTRVGLNTGIAVVGNIGSELRFNYTMMGASVNLAQRLEAAASLYGAEILVSSHTAEAALRDDASLVFRELDHVVLPGQNSAVTVFQLLGRGEAATKESAARLESYGRALSLYRQGKWTEAAEAFMLAAEHEPSVRRVNPCVVMASRCESLELQGAEAPGDYVLRKA